MEGIIIFGAFVGLNVYFVDSKSLQNEEITHSIEPNKSQCQPPRRKRLQLPTVEVCLSDIESVRAAHLGGATSIELCVARSEGGITPSVGLVQEAVRLLKSSDVEVNVLIRPRAGNFTYSAEEYDIILRDIVAMKLAGADGVVVGFLDSNRKIDLSKLSGAKQAAGDMSLTFHRAFDICSDPVEALEAIIRVGCDRLLTSGQCASAGSEEGKAALKKIAMQARGRIRVIAAAGVNQSNVSAILQEALVQGVHTGSAVTRPRDHSRPDRDELRSSSSSSSSSSSANIGLQEGEDIDVWPAVDVSLVQAFSDTSRAAHDCAPGHITLKRLQHPTTCSGMFWRGDPYTRAPPPSTGEDDDSWPRNGSMLRGSGPHRVDGRDWFHVLEYQQSHADVFVSVPEGTWMLYQQGGPLLHDL